MCKSAAQGGQRCAAHTRPTYRAASFGTPAWDEAAAQYASTPSGEREIALDVAVAEQQNQFDRAAALRTALRVGASRRQAHASTRVALNPRTTLAPSQRTYTPADIRNAPLVTTFNEGMTCGHDRSMMVGQDGLGGWQPREVYACEIPGCTTPAFAINPMREAEASGFAPDDEDDDWNY